MPLAPGTRVGPYEIVDLIEAGGRGEVYRARDKELGRDVAIKVIPEAHVDDPQRRARLQREAQILAKLRAARNPALVGVSQVVPFLAVADVPRSKHSSEWTVADHELDLVPT